MANYFRRRGMVFVDGRPLEPVESPRDLPARSARSLNFFSEVHWTAAVRGIQPYAGQGVGGAERMTLHIRLANDETRRITRSRSRPRSRSFRRPSAISRYIRVKGITFQHAGNGFPVPQRGMVSTNRGNHFIFEDNTFEWANSVGLDIGNEDWAASRPPVPVGFDVVRDNTFRYCGIEGLGGTGGPEGSLTCSSRGTFSNGSAGRTRRRCPSPAARNAPPRKNLLFRNNVVRHIRHANGIWLDIRQRQRPASRATCSPIFPAT